MRIRIMDYATGAEVWRGEIDSRTWDNYVHESDQHTGACRSSVLLDQGHLTGQKIPQVIFAEEV